MRTQRQLLDAYRKTHCNPTNVLVHTICVPVIFFAGFGLLWSVPVGAWLGLGEPGAQWVNAATIGMLPVLAFYFRLSFATGLEMLAVTFLCALACVVLRTAGPMPFVWACAVAWILAWLAQFYGHYKEGAKPSFLDDPLFLLIGPIFVLEKYGLLAGARTQASRA
jgi:uncharacterized membrane protein YGL010W